MRLTNNFDIPEMIVRATVKRNALYNKGKVHRSVTQLVNSPRVDILRKRHAADLEQDVSDAWWSLLGSAVHDILQMGSGPEHVTEERLFANVDGWDISGAIDVQETINGQTGLYDYKITQVYVVRQDETKPEWERQMNIYSYLMKVSKGIDVSSLTIVAILRDWQRAIAQGDPSYPQCPIQKISVPCWTFEEQERYVRERIHLHRNVEMIDGFGGEVVECTDEERWSRPHVWALMKKGGKRASKLFDNEVDAMLAVDGMKGYEIVFRPGQDIRCEGNYCQVSKWCSQFAAKKAAKEST